MVTVETIGRTGVEMEALAAVSVGLLTIYDMCKAVDRAMIIEDIKLLEKAGGRSALSQAASVIPVAAENSRGLVTAPPFSARPSRPFSGPEGRRPRIPGA